MRASKLWSQVIISLLIQLVRINDLKSWTHLALTATVLAILKGQGSWWFCFETNNALSWALVFLFGTILSKSIESVAVLIFSSCCSSPWNSPCSLELRAAMARRSRMVHGAARCHWLDGLPTTPGSSRLDVLSQAEQPAGSKRPCLAVGCIYIYLHI